MSFCSIICLFSTNFIKNDKRIKRTAAGYKFIQLFVYAVKAEIKAKNRNM